jgi:hypothetical protein
MSLAQQFGDKELPALPPQFQKLPLHKSRGANELLEFQKFGGVEPSHAFTEIHREGMQFTKRKFDKMVTISQRPGHSEKVIEQLYKKFKEFGREAELDGILEGQYDPIGPWVEMQNFDEQIKINNLTEIIYKDKLVEIAWQVFFAGLLLLLQQVLIAGDLGGFTKIIYKELDPILVGLAILLWHILQEFLGIKVVLEFTRSELMRIRASCTTGNLVQLLMRTELKLNFLERRSMKYYAKAHDFWRVLDEEFLQVPWFSHPTGREKFGSLVADYIENKIQRGLKIEEITADEKIEFQKTLQESLIYHLFIRFHWISNNLNQTNKRFHWISFKKENSIT